MKTKGEGAKAATAAVKEYRSQKNEFEEEFRETVEQLAEVQRQLDVARNEAAAALLVDVSPTTLDTLSAALGIAPSLSAMREENEARQPARQKRRAAIEENASFQQRGALLGDGEHGALVVEVRDREQLSQAAIAALEKFAVEPYLWVKNREEMKGEGGFKNFFHVVTFGETRLQMAKSKACKLLGFEMWDELEAAHQSALDQSNAANAGLNDARERLVTLQGLVREAADLDAWLHHFDRRLQGEMQTQLFAVLADVDARAAHKALQAHPGRKGLAKLHGLQAKATYLMNIRDHLQREMDDRQKRISSISRVGSLWERKPWDRLSGDKSKWLVQVPKMKRASTTKRRRFVRRMRTGVYEHDDWDRYDHYMVEYDVFLPFDVFGYCSEEGMPYDGFCREVIEDVQPFREEQGQERQNYDWFKQADKDWGRADEAADDGQGADDATAAVAAAAVLAAEMAEAEAAAAEALAESEGVEMADAS